MHERNKKALTKITKMKVIKILKLRKEKLKLKNGKIKKKKK